MEKRKLTRTVSVICIAAMVLMIFAGCNNSPAAQSTSNGGGGGGSEFGLVGDPSEEYYALCFVSGVEYWFPVFAAFKQAGNQLGVQTFYTGTTEYDANKQVEVFNQTLAKNPKGIFVSPITAEAFKEPIDRAVDQGVAIVTWASDSPDSARQALVTSDNINEGRTAAREMAAKLGESGKVMVMRNPGQTNHDIRCDTFISTINDEFPNMEVVADEVSNQDPDATATAVKTVYQKHGDLGGVFTPEANSASGATSAALELGADIKIICCDVNTQVLDLLQEDNSPMYMALNPDQGTQGYFAMQILFAIAHPERTDFMNGAKETGNQIINIPMLDNGLTKVTAENAQFFYVDKYAESLGFKNIEDMLSPGGPGNQDFDPHTGLPR